MLKATDTTLPDPYYEFEDHKGHILSPIDEAFIAMLQELNIDMLESGPDVNPVQYTLETIYEEQDDEPPLPHPRRLFLYIGYR